MMKQAALIAAALLLSTGAIAQDKAPEKKSCYQTNPFEKEVGYCNAVRIGNTLHVSGAAAAGPMPDAINRVYGSLKKTLDAHGMTLAHVVKETVYATDLDAFIKHQAMRKALYGDSFPAATWVQVTRLYAPSLVLEVEVTAVLP